VLSSLKKGIKGEAAPVQPGRNPGKERRIKTGEVNPSKIHVEKKPNEWV
jgi:hypothetical protein